MDEPIAISIAECARLLSVTRKHVYTLIDTDPDFPRTFKLGRCTRVTRSEILQYITNCRMSFDTTRFRACGRYLNSRHSTILSKRLQSALDSTGGCNRLAESLSWRFVV